MMAAMDPHHRQHSHHQQHQQHQQQEDELDDQGLVSMTPSDMACFVTCRSAPPPPADPAARAPSVTLVHATSTRLRGLSAAMQQRLPSRCRSSIDPLASAADATLRRLASSTTRYRHRHGSLQPRASNKPSRHHDEQRDQLPEVVKRQLLAASKACTSAMVREARDLLHATSPRNLQRAGLRPVSASHDGFRVYEQVGKPTPTPTAKVVGRSASWSVGRQVSVLDDRDASPSQSQSLSHSGQDVPRTVGVRHVDVSLDDFVAAFASPSLQQQQHGTTATTSHYTLNPGIFTSERVFTLLDAPNKTVTVNWMELQPRGVRSLARRRDLLVVTCEKRFQMPDGRQGWVQSMQSVELPGGWTAAQHGLQSASDGKSCVRGSMSRTGVVALARGGENADIHVVDVVAAAEMDLNGSASMGARRGLGRHRVVKILANLPQAVEQHRVQRLSYLATQQFELVEGYQKDKSCRLCHTKLAQLPRWKPRHSCRKCGASVCGQCSRSWNVERHRSQALVGGGRVCTPTRVCLECVDRVHEPKPKPTPMSLLRQYKRGSSSSSTVWSTDLSVSESVASSGAKPILSPGARSEASTSSESSSPSGSPRPETASTSSCSPLKHKDVMTTPPWMLTSIPPMRATVLEFSLENAVSGGDDLLQMYAQYEVDAHKEDTYGVAAGEEVVEATEQDVDEGEEVEVGEEMVMLAEDDTNEWGFVVEGATLEEEDITWAQVVRESEVDEIATMTL